MTISICYICLCLSFLSSVAFPTQNRKEKLFNYLVNTCYCGQSLIYNVYTLYLPLFFISPHLINLHYIRVCIRGKKVFSYAAKMIWSQSSHCVCVRPSGTGHSYDGPVYGHPGSFQLGTGSPGGLQEEQIEKDKEETEGHSIIPAQMKMQTGAASPLSL